MFAIEIRDHVMIAHSIPGEVFGPAQKLHGATYVVEAAFMRPRLDENDIVLDIGLATSRLHDILAAINYCNLDDHPAFKGRRSTTEAVAYWIFQELARAIATGALGASAKGLTHLKITLHESHVARASYEAPLGE